MKNVNAREKAVRVVRTVCVLVTFLSCAASFALTLPDQEWERIDLDDDHTSIEAPDKSRRSSAIPTETTGDLEIPGVLRGFRVVSLGKQAFYGCAKLTSVTIPEGVTNIADQAFYNCSSLTNVVFPSTLKSIGASAFIGCQNLARINIEALRLTIGDRAFRDCDGLQTIRFTGDELIMDTRAFFGCGGLRDVNLVVKDITLSEGVFSGGYDPYPSRYGYCDHLTNVIVAASNRVEFGVSVFAGCSALQQLMLTAGAELNVGSTAFSGCTALRQATLTAGAGMKVGASAFSSCRYMTNVLMMASNRVELGASAFSSCTALQTIELPDGLVGVPQNAFNSCTSLQSVSLSSNVASIAYRAFDTCTSLWTVELAEGLRTIEAQAFYGCAALEDLRIPQSVSKVGARAFERCDGLGRLVFCEGDTNTPSAASVSVEERAFYRNGSLTNVVLSQVVTDLGARAFAECGSLISVNLPTNLAVVSESLFEFCELLSVIDLPPSLSEIGASAFNLCTNLSTFLIPTQNVVSVGAKAFHRTKYWNERVGELVTNNGYILGFNGNPTSVALPDDCKAIPNGMFEGMTALTNVTVPACLEKVGFRAFVGCGITSIDLSKTKVSTLGASAFEGCVSLRSATLAPSVTAIPDDAFRNCSALVSMDIPTKVASIGSSAFRDCVSLATVTGGAGVRTVGDYAFAGCVSLLSFRFQEDVAYGEHVFQGVRWTENVLFPSIGTMAQEYPQTYTEIKSVVVSSTQTGIVDRACAGCVSLETISIPDGVSRVGVSAFEGCTSLKSVVFPASVSNVGSNAFKGCSSIISLTTSGDLVVKDVFVESYAAMTSVKIAAGVTSLCDNMLSGCAMIASVDMPTSLESIGAYAFAGCTGLSGGVTIPEAVKEIGDYAFMDCIGLKTVRYMGAMPTANPNIYYGTSQSLVSGVRKAYAESWTGSSGLPSYWPLPQNNVSSRRIAWWDGPSEGSSAAGGKITFYFYDATGRKELADVASWPDDPDREGYDFLGWFTKPYGGIEVTEENYKELCVTKVYAHWVRIGENDPQTWDDVMYNVDKSCTYDGYLLEGDAMVGTIQLRMAKGKFDRENECYNVTVIAKVFILGEGKNLSFKGVAEDVGEDGGSADLVCTKKSDGRELSVTFTAKGLDGSLDGYEVVAARNLFANLTEWDRRAALAAVDDCSGTHAVVLRANGDAPLSSGYAALSVIVGSKGKTKVSGMLPDGTKVSVSSQLLILPDANEYVVPVVVPLYSGKKGGFGFGLRLLRDDEFGVVSDMTVFGATEWVANPGKANEFTSTLTEVGAGAAGNLKGPSTFAMADSFEIDAEILPDGTSVTPSGTKWSLPKADKVKFDRETESYEILTDYGNPTGLKLTYTAKTGLFKGSFKVYAVTDDGKSKKYTANVAGAVLDGIGYGTAVIKKVGSVPVVIEEETR